jgi:hypothetical protein
MAQIIALNVKSATLGAAALPGVLRFTCNVTRTIKSSKGDAAPGPGNLRATFQDITGTLELEDASALTTVFTAAAAALVVTGTTAAGTTVTVTIKKAMFGTSGHDLPGADSKDVGKTTVNWQAEWALTDAITDMITIAAA